MPDVLRADEPAGQRRTRSGTDEFRTNEISNRAGERSRPWRRVT
jgi:hypothetical protein